MAAERSIEDYLKVCAGHILLVNFVWSRVIVCQVLINNVILHYAAAHWVVIKLLSGGENIYSLGTYSIIEFQYQFGHNAGTID